MAPLINFPIDLSRTAKALEGIHTQLSRVADALERLAPAPQILEPPRPAGLSDLRRTDPHSIAQIKSELQVFADNHSLVMDSEAFVNSIIQYEKEVAEAYGPEAINELPWNKAAGGPIFQAQSHADHDEQARENATQPKGGESVSDPEPAPGTAQETEQ